jgi:hypothetical protein
MLDGQLYTAGARFLAGSNAATYGIMPGSGLHLELTLLHRIGLSPREALAAATSNYADVYGWRDVGRIEPGRVADLAARGRSANGCLGRRPYPYARIQRRGGRPERSLDDEQNDVADARISI